MRQGKPLLPLPMISLAAAAGLAVGLGGYAFAYGTSDLGDRRATATGFEPTLPIVAISAASPAPAARLRARHPDVTAERAVQDCHECHRRSTPAVVAEWERSPHGVALVKCLVCHRSTGQDFTRAPTPDRCLGCHAAEVASVTRGRGQPASCFTCHAPHALTAPGTKRPHAN